MILGFGITLRNAFSNTKDTKFCLTYTFSSLTIKYEINQNLFLCVACMR